MAFDYSKLTGRIIEKFGTRKAFAEFINVSEQSVSQRLNGARGFTQEDVETWSSALGIPKAEYHLYYFTLKV